MPAGGTISQFLIKESSTNYDAVWATMTGDVFMNGTSNFSATISTAAVTYAKINQLPALSVLANSSSAQAISTAVPGTHDQVLLINPAGTGLLFGQLNLSATAAITGFLSSSYLTGVFTGGVLPVIAGGSGTSALTANGLLVGNTTASVQIIAADTGGKVLLAQGTASIPAFQTMTGDFTLSSVGTATIATNVVTYVKFQQISALSVHANSSSATANSTAVAGTTNQVLRVAPNGTSLGFGQLNLSSTSAVTGFLNATSYLTGIVSVALGGTGTSALTANGVLVGSGTSAVAIAVAGTSTFVLASSGTSSAPAFSQVNLTSAVSGILPVANGGTGATAFVQGSIPFAGASGIYTQNNTALFFDNTSGALGVGTNTPFSDLGNLLGGLVVRKDQNAETRSLFENNSAGTSAIASVELATGLGNTYCILSLSNNSGSPFFSIGAGPAVSNVYINPGNIGFTANFNSSGSLILGTSAIPTSATAGFLYITSMAGTATGTANLTGATGRVPMVYDTSNNRLWIYNGSWRSAAFA